MPKRPSERRSTDGSPNRGRRAMRRRLCDHHWESLEEWVQTLDELAELSDHEIEELVGRPPSEADESYD